MIVAMVLVFVFGAVLLRIATAPRQWDENLAVVGAVAVGVSGLWFLWHLLAVVGSGLALD